MVRADVEVEAVEPLHLAGHPPLFRMKLQHFLQVSMLRVRHVEPPHLGGARGVLLAQRVPLPPRRHEDAAQVRVTVKPDAEHVPHFTLIPVRRGPEVHHARAGGILADQRHFHPDVGIACERQQVVDQGKIRRRLPHALLPLAFIDGRQVIEHRVRLCHLVLEEAQQRRRLPRLRPHRRHPIARRLK